MSSPSTPNPTSEMSPTPTVGNSQSGSSTSVASQSGSSTSVASQSGSSTSVASIINNYNSQTSVNESSVYASVPEPQTIIISRNSTQSEEEGTANTEVSSSDKHRVQNENDSQRNVPLPVQEKKNSKQNKNKFSKEQFSGPADFKWVTHVSFDDVKGLDNSNVDDKIQGFFNIPSSSPSTSTTLPLHNQGPGSYETTSTSPPLPQTITQPAPLLPNTAPQPPQPTPHTRNIPPPPSATKERSKKQDEKEEQSKTPLPIQQVKRKKSIKWKISKDQIGAPKDFRHVAHVGYDPNINVDERLQGFFDIVGISHEQLADTHTREFVYDFIEKNGGIEKAIEESQRFDALKPGKPGLTSPTLHHQPNSLEYAPGWDHILKKGDKETISGSNLDLTLTSNTASDNTISSAISIASDNTISSAISIASDNNWHSTMSNEEIDEDDKWEYRIIDPNKAGVQVRALYDYEGNDVDELSFKVDDIFEKIEDEDAQGWCTGSKDGIIGLYPPNYVEVIDSELLI